MKTTIVALMILATAGCAAPLPPINDMPKEPITRAMTIAAEAADNMERCRQADWAKRLIYFETYKDKLEAGAFKGLTYEWATGQRLDLDDCVCHAAITGTGYTWDVVIRRYGHVWIYHLWCNEQFHDVDGRFSSFI